MECIPPRQGCKIIEDLTPEEYDRLFAKVQLRYENEMIGANVREQLEI